MPVMPERAIPLSTKLGELMAPGTLVTALIVSPDETVKLDPGALHGRSELESQLELVQQKAEVGPGQSCWIVWLSIELDSASHPIRYKGISVCEVFVNVEKRVGYKSLAEHVNRMGEAMRGGVNLGRLTPEMRQLIRQQLVSINRQWWDQSPDALKRAVESP